MTHCAGFRAAAAASTNDIRGVGIDAELHVPLPEEILDIILLPEERPMVEDLSARYPDIAWERLIFSAKESVFKAWFPLTRQWLDFLECRILIDAPARRFQARIRALGPAAAEHGLTVIDGRWMAEGPSGRGLLGTSVIVP